MVGFDQIGFIAYYHNRGVGHTLPQKNDVVFDILKTHRARYIKYINDAATAQIVRIGNTHLALLATYIPYNHMETDIA